MSCASSPQYIYGFSPEGSASHSHLSAPRRAPSSPSVSSSPSASQCCAENSTINFSKIPFPVSTAVSTDSEGGAFSSDWHLSNDPRGSAVSPSLISTIFQSQTFSRSRQPSAASTSGSTYPTPVTPSTGGTLSAGGTRPILRQDTFSTSGEECGRDMFHGFDLGYQASHGDAQPPLKKKQSVLTFAVNPCPTSPRSTDLCNFRNRSRSRSTSTSLSGLSGSPNLPCRSPAPKTPSLGSRGTGSDDEDDDEEDNEEEDDDFTESSMAIPGHESDSDEGYHEDEEDGFTSDGDDEAGNDIGTFTNIPKFHHRPSWASNHWSNPFPTNVPSITLATTPKKRGRTIEPYPPSTTDDGVADPSFSKHKRIIHIVTDKPSAPRCTRHRSPPPPIITAPPAARSPSAAGLCRRRGSSAASPRGPSASVSSKLFVNTNFNTNTDVLSNANAPSPAPLSGLRPTRGWKSDDAAFFPSRKAPQSASVVETGGRVRFPIMPPNARKCSLPVQMQGGSTSTGGILRKGPPESNGEKGTEAMRILTNKSEQRSRGEGLSRSFDGGFMGEMEMEPEPELESARPRAEIEMESSQDGEKEMVDNLEVLTI